MKNALKLTGLGIMTFIGSASFGQSLNINAGYTTSGIRMENESEGTATETYNGSTYTSTYEFKNVSGFNAAIAYEFRLGDRFSLETGFKYQSRGYKQVYEYSYESSIESTSESSAQVYKINYFDLPIVLNTAIATGDLRVYARTGIYVGIMTGARYNSSQEYTSSNGDIGMSEYNQRISGSDLEIEERFTGGFILGAGVEYKGFYVESNYAMGAFMLTAIDNGTYTRDLSFSLGYKFKFNK